MREPSPAGARALAVVVLAAGRGSRLPPEVRRVPKWLLTVAGSSVAERQLEGLRRAASAWSRLLVVTGYRSERFDASALSAAVGRPCELVHNRMFERVNNWLSLHLALTKLAGEGWAGGVCVVNADLLLPPRLLARFLETAARSEASLLAVDVRPVSSEEQMKVVLDETRRSALDIGKSRLAGASHGEFIGLSKVDSRDLPLLRCVLASFVDDPGRASEWYEGAFREAMREGLAFRVFPVETGRWVEIDDGSDLERAHELALSLGNEE